jgi:hypothetical protein
MSANEGKPIDEEIARLDAQIARLEGMLEELLQAKALIQGQGEPAAEPRKRSRNIKPLIIDTMIAAAYDGATSADVSAIVREKVPSVAKYTVRCTLSRLKADGALAFDGERYFESRFAPKSERRSFEPKLVRVVQNLKPCGASATA